MRPKSAKAKGRRFQQEVRDAFLEASPSLEKDDIRSNPMGAPGEDLLLSPAARKLFPYSVECKNVEKLQLWPSIKQAEEHAKDTPHTPVVIFKKNGENPHVIISLEEFINLCSYRRDCLRGWDEDVSK